VVYATQKDATRIGCRRKRNGREGEWIWMGACPGVAQAGQGVTTVTWARPAVQHLESGRGLKRGGQQGAQQNSGKEGQERQTVSMSVFFL